MSQNSDAQQQPQIDLGRRVKLQSESTAVTSSQSRRTTQEQMLNKLQRNLKQTTRIRVVEPGEGGRQIVEPASEKPIRRVRPEESPIQVLPNKVKLRASYYVQQRETTPDSQYTSQDYACLPQPAPTMPSGPVVLKKQIGDHTFSGPPSSHQSSSRPPLSSE